VSGVSASSDAFRAVADPTRRALLERLRESECTVKELGRPFRVSQPAISQHLRILTQAGLVKSRRSGRERRYRLNAKPLAEVYRWAARFVEVRDPFGHAWHISQRERTN